MALRTHHPSAMDYPPWLPQPENTHTGRLLAVARCRYELHHREEQHLIKGPMKTFDNLCAGPLELAAEVLHLAGFTEYLDEYGRRSVFICGPADFESVASSSAAQSIDTELIKTAVIRLSDEGFGATEEIHLLTERLRFEG